MTRRLRVVPPPAEPCQQYHEPGPADPVEWNAWALDRQITHYVERCPDCGRYVVWFHRTKPIPDTPTTPETETP